jgi:hypothetical protein
MAAKFQRSKPTNETRVDAPPRPDADTPESPADTPLDPASTIADQAEASTSSSPVAREPRRRGARATLPTDGPKRKSTMRLAASAHKRLRDHCHYRDVDAGDVVSRLILANIPEYTMGPVKRGMVGSINESASEENSAA